MTGLRIAATGTTPEIIMNPSGSIIISGRSMSKNADEFYRKMDSWLEVYMMEPADMTRIDIWLEYFDRVNLSAFMSVLKKIKKVSQVAKEFEINWHYEEDDEDILAQGENLSQILNIPVNMVMISEYNY
ncbi:MAG TPA: SiaC family regulatory phosphoprotein [Bacteroidales bacterium]|nr:SiaC family regulatory phosphoprotein [Bacteroidales bacterium]